MERLIVFCLPGCQNRHVSARTPELLMVGYRFQHGTWSGIRGGHDRHRSLRPVWLRFYLQLAAERVRF